MATAGQGPSPETTASAVTSALTSAVSTLVSTTTTSSATASSTGSNNNNNNNNNGGSSPGSFYKNLFYILIGLLCAFGLISFLSLLRTRQRRNQIFREAARLGVIVPGLPGYVPIRERRNARWARSNGKEDPDWWEVDKNRDDEEAMAGRSENGPTPLTGLDLPGEQQNFYPLSIMPPLPQEPPVIPIERSPLPFFPNHLAYRPESLIPPPPKFSADDMAGLSGLAGDYVDVATIIRMPYPQWPADREVSEEEAVFQEWVGAELGVTSLEVVGPILSGNANVERRS